MNTDERNGHGEKYSRLKEVALAALLKSNTLGEAAQKAGISVSTLRRWLQDHDFRKDYNEEKRHILETVTRELSGAAVDAIQVLRDQINNWRSDAKDRRASANVILNAYSKEMQRYCTERRLSILEQKLADEQPPSAEDNIEESQCCGKDVKEIDAEAPGVFPEHRTPPTEGAVTASPTQMSADGGEKRCDGSDAEDLNHENTAEEGTGNGISKKPVDAQDILRWIDRERVERGKSGTVHINTGLATPEAQASADEHQGHEPEKEQDERLRDFKGLNEILASILK